MEVADTSAYLRQENPTSFAVAVGLTGCCGWPQACEWRRRMNPPETPVSPPLRILLIEDDSAYAEFTQTMLESARPSRIEVDHTTSVRGAIDLLASQLYDIALLDLGLPDAQE